MHGLPDRGEGVGAGQSAQVVEIVEAAQEFIGLEGAGCIRRCKDIGGVLGHQREDGVQVFIGHNPVDNDE